MRRLDDTISIRGVALMNEHFITFGACRTLKLPLRNVVHGVELGGLDGQREM